MRYSFFSLFPLSLPVLLKTLPPPSSHDIRLTRHPSIHSLAKAVSPSLTISEGAQHLHDINYIWGFLSAFVLYWAFSAAVPARETLLLESIYEDEVVTGMPPAEGADSISSESKGHYVAPTKGDVEVQVAVTKTG